MIKAEDLRIGDLVRYGQQVYTIQAVNANGAVCFAESDLLPVECSLLDPIPITTEILEKNGFEVRRKTKGLYSKFVGSPDRFISKYISIECDECNPIGWRVIIEYDKFTRYADLRKIHYVHELQHILWALGEDANLKV